MSRSSSSSSSSDSDDSSQSSSDSSDSSSSGSSSPRVTVSTQQRPNGNPSAKVSMGKLIISRPPGQQPPPPASRPAAATTAAAAHKTSNPQLSYTHPDAAPIPHPSPPYGTYGSLIGTIDGDRRSFPLRRYRYVDYLITAIDMFLAVLRSENVKQMETSAKAGREHKKFTWGNKGELAITFTLTCDMLKNLHDKLAAPKPKWEDSVKELTFFLMRSSQIPTDILTEKTYHQKYLDWKKGGTRYDQEDHSNVRFPSAEERLKKLETRIQTGADYGVQSTVVEAPPAAAAAVVLAQPPSTVTALAPSEGPSPSPVATVPAGPGPIANRTKIPPLGTASFKQPHEAPRPFHWTSELNAIKGNASLILLPRDRLDKMPALINMCAKCETADHFCAIADLISQSPVDVQAAFEAQGGLVFVKRWLCSCMRTKNEAAVRTLAERTVSMKLRAWSAKTRAAWHNGCVNLDWLRAAEFFGMKPQLWNDTVSRLEQLAMSPSEASSSHEWQGGPAKRNRDGDVMLESASLEDSKTHGTNAPSHAHLIDRAAFLPQDLRYAPMKPAALNSLEAASLSVLWERRQSFAAHIQSVLRDRVTAVASTQPSHERPFPMIPLYADPYSLLGVPHQVTTRIM
ncbi:Hypothetical protein, putative [Bodo saltans]|uniref:Uncharacterized protein n=1 Tax=Bodo saltans TaxID=75058 RepID=A0A0S4JPG4_BODSA|nr:Hypothetical protein, putative [Bodo saltans]|eukprot:CUG91247.1 Hypothetical protein, putative [Bodo saltans]